MFLKFANDRIGTTDLWCRKQLFCQLSHNHCPGRENNFNVNQSLTTTINTRPLYVYKLQPKGLKRFILIHCLGILSHWTLAKCAYCNECWIHEWRHNRMTYKMSFRQTKERRKCVFAFKSRVYITPFSLPPPTRYYNDDSNNNNNMNDDDDDDDDDAYNFHSQVRSCLATWTRCYVGLPLWSIL